MSKIIKATLEYVALQEKGAIISGPFGSNISSKFFVAKGVPVIRGNNLSLSYDKFYDKGFVFVTKEKAEELKCYAYKDDLIFTAAGTLGQVGIIPETSLYAEYVISNKQIRVRIDQKKVDVLYAYYWFSSPWIQELLKKNNKGSTVPLLTLSEIRDLPIRYPESLTEQQKIANCIETISKKIVTNQLINDNLVQMAKTIYDYWFTQFDFPDENGKPYRSSGGQMVWNEQ
ncbi:restriction endonuclease subunit S, partial [Helicobacter sp. 12S02634-8]|uniref:restriction endonuclease subunit S n=1 Tax=Helicobacter sp. 12S02634-8 TaxID=1476199 RepID=UPI0015537E04